MKTPRLAVVATVATLLAMAAPPAHATFPAGTDSFAGAPEITTNADSSFETNLTPCTAEAGEPDHHTVSDGNSAWWRWTAPANGFCTLDTLLGASLPVHANDTIIAVYTGTSVDALTKIASADDVSGTRLTELTFAVTEGTTYRIAVDIFMGSTPGPVLLRLRHYGLDADTRTTAFVVGAEVGDQGLLTLSRTERGTVSGVVIAGARRYPLKGVIGAKGELTVAFLRKKPTGPPVTIEVDYARDLPNATFSTVGGFMVQNLQTVHRHSGQSPSPRAGFYNGITVRLATDGGRGIFTLKVAANGKVKGLFIMEDGQKVPFASRLHDSVSFDTIPIHVPLFRGKGCFTAVLAVTLPAQGSAAVALFGYYLRPPGDTFFPDGLSAFLAVDGAVYAPPASGSRALDFLAPTMGAGKLSIPAIPGEIDAVEEALTFGTDNTFTFTSATREPSLKLDVETGIVTGSIIEPTGRKRKLTGVLYQSTAPIPPTLAGFGTGTTRTISFTVIP